MSLILFFVGDLVDPEPVGITDSVVLTITKAITDEVGITEYVQTAKDGLTPLVTDAVGLTDSAETVRSIARTITDTVGVTDTESHNERPYRAKWLEIVGSADRHFFHLGDGATANAKNSGTAGPTYNGVRTGSVTQQPALADGLGLATGFPGAGWFTVPDGQSISGTDPEFSVAAWIKTSTAPVNYYTIACQRDAGGSGYLGSWTLRVVNTAGLDGISIWGYGTGASYDFQANFYQPEGILFDGQPHLIGFSVDRTAGSAYIYVDGTLFGNSLLSGGVYSSTIDIGIGRDIRDGTETFVGDMSDVGIATTVISAAEWAELFSAGWGPYITDPVGITDTIFVYDDPAGQRTRGSDLAITDSVGVSRTLPTTDDVGITDSLMTGYGREPTDAVGITDSIVIVEAFDLPSIDGATELIGVNVLELLDPSGNPTYIDVPSIDGASAPNGVILRTETIQTGIDNASSEVWAELWNADSTAKLADLTGQITLQWQDVGNDLGIGTLTINRHDTDAALIAVGQQIFCYLYGIHVYTFIVEAPPDASIYDPANESAENLTVSGPGRNVLCEDGLVYAPKGLADPLNPAHRLYSFASIDYVPGPAWQPAIQQYRADQVDPHRFQYVEWTYKSTGPEPDTVELVATPAPIGWPDDLAYWIWGATDRYKVGWSFFRNTFLLQEDSTVAFCVSADNYYTLYLDGTPILGETSNSSCWAEYKRIEMLLPAGIYTLAAVVQNISGDFVNPTDNPAGLLYSVFVPDPTTGDPQIYLSRSDSTCLALAYPATWPGWTPGEIMLDIIAEAQARGELANLAWDFTGATDSAGNPWPYTQGFSIPVGGSLLDAINSLVEQGWIDYRVAPGGLVLQAFVADWSPDSGVTLQATGVEATTNLESYTITPQTTPKTRLFVTWSGGNFQLDDAAAQATYDIKPMHVSLDAPTFVEAVRHAQVILDNVKGPQDAIQAGLAPTGWADRPYFAFRNMEKLTVPNRAGGSGLEKLLSISVSHNEVGRAIIGLELQTRVQKRERENQELLDQLGGATKGSQKVRATLYQTDPLVQL